MDPAARTARPPLRRHLHTAARTLVPARDDPHGPLPPMLVALTVVTGLIDAFTLLEAGRVFVANMTGNVVFLAFAIAGIPGYVWWASALGVLAFLGGAIVGGRIARHRRSHRGRLLRDAVIVQTGLIVTGAIVSLVAVHPYQPAATIVLIALLGTAMGIQNAAVRALAVPDLTTTVLTLTLAGISADGRFGGGEDSRLGRRLVAVLALALGAVVGALLSLGHLAALILIGAAAVAGLVATAAGLSSRSGGDWAATR